MDFKEFLNEQRRRGVKAKLKKADVPEEDPLKQKEPDSTGTRNPNKPAVLSTISASTTRVYNRLSKLLSERDIEMHRGPGGVYRRGPGTSVVPRPGPGTAIVPTKPTTPPTTAVSTAVRPKGGWWGQGPRILTKQPPTPMDLFKTTFGKAGKKIAGLANWKKLWADKKPEFVQRDAAGKAIGPGKHTRMIGHHVARGLEMPGRYANQFQAPGNQSLNRAMSTLRRYAPEQQDDPVRDLDPHNRPGGATARISGGR